MRFVFSPPAGEVSGLLTLPWTQPLEEWQDERLVEIRQRGISRHIVRFVEDSGELYALKSISETLARREYRLLRSLADLSIPAVEVVGIVVDRGRDEDAILVTRFLEFSSTYRALFSSRRGGGLPTDSLLDALVELLVRLHLSGFFWGDCSLSNALFRADAGTYQAYLVDAETSEKHPTLTDGQRGFDLELAAERVCGELMDLQAGELLPDDVDPIEVSEDLVRPLPRPVGGAQPRGALQAGRSAPSHRQAAAPAQRARLRCRRGGAHRQRGGHAAARADQGRRVGREQPAAVPADRYRRRGTSGPQAAERHRQLPRLPRAEERPRGLRDGRRASLAGGDLRPRRGGHPRRPARGGLPRRRSSTRSWSTAGTCRRQPAGMSARPPRPDRISTPCCPPSRSRSAREQRPNMTRCPC